MYIDHQKEQFSRAYVAAIAAQAGCNQSVPEVDDDSIDLELSMKDVQGCKRTRGKIELQLKCTSKADLSGDSFLFPLKAKNYNELRDDVLEPRYLVVVCVPDNLDDWTSQSEEELCLRKCGYWLSLAGQPKTSNTSSVTVTIPRNHIFSVDFLKEAMRRSANGENL